MLTLIIIGILAVVFMSRLGVYDPNEHIIGYGKHIAYADTVNGSYTTVTGTIDIHTPERELGKSEVTNDDSPDYHKDYVPGMFEPGTVTFKYRYARSMFAALETIFQLASVTATRATAQKYWKVTLPDGSTCVFKGFLTKHNLPVDGLEDSPEVDCEIQVKGKMTWTSGSGS